ncbi:aminopeptidase N, partial [Streptomyces sp. SID6648]|nr:aminopeptidase N [Streptomyces sp. SID6648]
ALTVHRAGERPHRIAVGLYDQDPGEEGRLTPRERLDIDVPQTAPRPIGKLPALVVLNDGDLSYAKIRFDADSFHTLRASLSGLPDPLTRAVVWNALRDA